MEHGLEILLVEDDARDARLTIQELQKSNLKNLIQLARDGEEALDFLFCRGSFARRSIFHPPALILLDLKLPKVDGLEVLRELRSRPETSKIPVVVLTSSREEKDLVDSYRLGINSYIQKPVDFDQFRETIKTLGLYWLVVNEPPPEKLFTGEGA
jgi:CheY-like chemotaxis protein